MIVFQDFLEKIKSVDARNIFFRAPWVRYALWQCFSGGRVGGNATSLYRRSYSNHNLRAQSIAVDCYIFAIANIA